MATVSVEGFTGRAALGLKHHCVVQVLNTHLLCHLAEIVVRFGDGVTQAGVAKGGQDGGGLDACGLKGRHGEYS